jgi:glycosyltransferase involved in cell wall biosynthesis
MFDLFPEYAAAARSRPYRLFRWAVCNQVQRVICISQRTADDVTRLWRINPGRLDVIHLGTSFLDSPAVTAVPGVAAEDRIVLSCYNLEPRKNLASLLRAFARCHSAGVRLVLYGKSAVTPDRERDFDVLVRELGIGPAITRTGYVSDEQLGWLFRRAEVFVFPSLYEGFGYPVLEAMAAGTCVIARRASAMAEVVGPAGVLVETTDPEQITCALNRLLGDPNERERLRQQAAVRAQRFTIRQMAEQTLQTYTAVLAAKSRRHRSPVELSGPRPTPSRKNA